MYLKILTKKKKKQNQFTNISTTMDMTQKLF